MSFHEDDSHATAAPSMNLAPASLADSGDANGVERSHEGASAHGPSRDDPQREFVTKRAAKVCAWRSGYSLASRVLLDCGRCGREVREHTCRPLHMFRVSRGRDSRCVRPKNHVFAPWSSTLTEVVEMRSA